MSKSIRIPVGSKKHPGLFATVDAEDYALVADRHWSLHQSGPRRRYAFSWERTETGRCRIWMHRLIAGTSVDRETDHWDGNGLNNRRKNLRNATHQQNLWNQESKGIHFRKSQRIWEARIRHEGKFLLIGYFKTEREAKDAYRIAARHYRGEWTRA